MLSISPGASPPASPMEAMCTNPNSRVRDWGTTPWRKLPKVYAPASPADTAVVVAVIVTSLPAASMRCTARSGGMLAATAAIWPKRMPMSRFARVFCTGSTTSPLAITSSYLRPGSAGLKPSGRGAPAWATRTGAAPCASPWPASAPPAAAALADSLMKPRRERSIAGLLAGPPAHGGGLAGELELLAGVGDRGAVHIQNGHVTVHIVAHVKVRQREQDEQEEGRRGSAGWTTHGGGLLSALRAETRAPGAGRDRGTGPHPPQARAGARRSVGAAQAAVAADQRVGGGVVPERGLVSALELRRDPAGERLAQLHAPLVERVDPPDGALHEHLVLVERDEAAEGGRSERVGHDGVGRPVTLEGAVRHLRGRDPLGGRLGGGLAEGERLGLRDQVRGEQILMPAERVECPREADEVGRDQSRALMEELVVGVLTVGAGGAPDDRTGLVVHPPAVQVHRLAVRLHVELLEVERKPREVVAVRQHRVALRAEEVHVPDPEQAEQHRQVALERRGAEVLVHLAEAREHGPEVLGADRDHQREPDGRVVGVATAHPVPELEHVGGVDAELGHLRRVGGHRHEVARDRLRVAERPQRPVARRVRVGQRLL